LIDFVEYIMTQFQKIIKSIQSNNFVEFKMDSFYYSHGIIHQTTYIKTP